MSFQEDVFILTSSELPFLSMTFSVQRISWIKRHRFQTFSDPHLTSVDRAKAFPFNKMQNLWHHNFYQPLACRRTWKNKRKSLKKCTHLKHSPHSLINYFFMRKILFHAIFFHSTVPHFPANLSHAKTTLRGRGGNASWYFRHSGMSHAYNKLFNFLLMHGLISA